MNSNLRFQTRLEKHKIFECFMCKKMNVNDQAMKIATATLKNIIEGRSKSSNM